MVDYFNTSPVPINFIANAVQGAYKNLRFPFKFQPLDLRGGPSYNFVFSSKIQNIFVSSKGDSTQDIYRNGFQSPILYHSVKELNYCRQINLLLKKGHFC